MRKMQYCITFMFFAFFTIGCDLVGTQSSSGSGSVETGDGALKSGMSPQEMLECTSGSLSLTRSQWEALENIANWTIYHTASGAAGVSGTSYYLSAYNTYLEMVYSNGSYVAGVGYLGSITWYRYYK